MKHSISKSICLFLIIAVIIQSTSCTECTKERINCNNFDKINPTYFHLNIYYKDSESFNKLGYELIDLTKPVKCEQLDKPIFIKPKLIHYSQKDSLNDIDYLWNCYKIGPTANPSNLKLLNKAHESIAECKLSFFNPIDSSTFSFNELKLPSNNTIILSDSKDDSINFPIFNDLNKVKSTLTSKVCNNLNELFLVLDKNPFQNEIVDIDVPDETEIDELPQGENYETKKYIDNILKLLKHEKYEDNWKYWYKLSRLELKRNDIDTALIYLNNSAKKAIDASVSDSLINKVDTYKELDFKPLFNGENKIVARARGTYNALISNDKSMINVLINYLYKERNNEYNTINILNDGIYTHNSSVRPNFRIVVKRKNDNGDVNVDLQWPEDDIAFSDTSFQLNRGDTKTLSFEEYQVTLINNTNPEISKNYVKFGFEEKKVSSPPQEGENEGEKVDTDKDGVIDENDDCPTRKGPDLNDGCPTDTIKILSEPFVSKETPISVDYNDSKESDNITWSSHNLKIIDPISPTTRIISEKVGKFEIRCDIEGTHDNFSITKRKIIHIKISNAELAKHLFNLAEYGNYPDDRTETIKTKRNDSEAFLNNSIVSEDITVIKKGISGATSTNTFSELKTELLQPKLYTTDPISSIKVHNVSYNKNSGKLDSFEYSYD